MNKNLKTYEKMAGIAALGLGVLTFSPISAQQKPNIIFILADDLGYGDLGCYGQDKIETPNIDTLAGQGMRFTQFYAGSPVSAPSRCVLFTGNIRGMHIFAVMMKWVKEVTSGVIKQCTIILSSKDSVQCRHLPLLFHNF